MSVHQSFMGSFQQNKPQDNFFNLRRKEDISTIYHQEYLGDSEGLSDYWCEPPVGFKHRCDYIIGIFRDKVGLAIGVSQSGGNKFFTVLVKNPTDVPRYLIDYGIKHLFPYSENEINDIINSL